MKGYLLCRKVRGETIYLYICGHMHKGTLPEILTNLSIYGVRGGMRMEAAVRSLNILLTVFNSVSVLLVKKIIK